MVFGKPALSMAVDLPTFCHIEFLPIASNAIPFVEIDLPDCCQQHAFPFPIWQKLSIGIESRFKRFEHGGASIKTVLKQPVDLILSTLYHFHQQAPLKPGHWRIRIEGHGLIGKGLGSSAAVIVGLLNALFHHHDMNQNETELLALARTIECRQHGHSSGLDPAVIQRGGLIEYVPNLHLHSLEKRPFNAWLIDTGAPQVSTGQVVSHVKKRFDAHHPIWSEFEHTTQKIRQAWLEQDGVSIKQYVRENERLLEDIGVVPERVRQFIHQAQTQDTALKICGAGSHRGDQGGMVLCIAETPPLDLCHDYGYNCIAMNLDDKGCQCEMG